MHLPGRLSGTTLGDLLGSLHRAEKTGVLELATECGRLHRVFLRNGLVLAVEVDAASAPLAEWLLRDGVISHDVLRRSVLRSVASRKRIGEVLVREFRIAPEVVSAALRRQMRARVAQLELLTDARVNFRVMAPLPPGALDTPLSKSEFLAGRKRRRDRDPRSGVFRIEAPAHHRVLGVSENASVEEVRRAYKRLVRTLHPDLHPTATVDENRELTARLREVTDAYRALVA